MSMSKFIIEGMSCDKCVQSINTALIKEGGIKAIDVNLKEGYAFISYNEDIINDDKIINIIENLGFDVKIEGK